LTVTLQLADLPPHDAVIVAVPGPLADTFPFESTWATEEFEVDHVTVLSVAFAGAIVAVSFPPRPASNKRVERSNITFSTGMFDGGGGDGGGGSGGVVGGVVGGAVVGAAVTVTLQLALLPLQVTVIVAVPVPAAVTFPFELTVAIDRFELDHDNVLSVALLGSTVAVSLLLPPLSSEMLD